MFRPMLAARTEGKGLYYPLLLSPKLDGIRALVVDGVVRSRSMKPIPNQYIQEKYGKAELNGADGELILGDPTDPFCFRKTTSAVMSNTYNLCSEVCYYIFDKTDSDNPYYMRQKELEAYTLPVSPFITQVIQSYVGSDSELFSLEESLVSAGYEGVMLRDSNTYYKNGRSTHNEACLLKLKRFNDSEAIVCGFEECNRNSNAPIDNELGYVSRTSHSAGMVGKNTLGALLVRDCATGVEFSIGSGFTAGERYVIWNDQPFHLGKIVKYKFFPKGSKDKPRFPIFLGFRSIIDLALTP